MRRHGWFWIGLLLTIAPAGALADEWEWFRQFHASPITGLAGDAQALTTELYKPRLADGYSFTVSSDEAWIATIAADDVWLYHRLTGNTWVTPLPENSPLPTPAMFTPENHLLILPTHGAFLDPKSETLELSPIDRDPVLIESPDTFLSHDPERDTTNGRSSRVGEGFAVVAPSETGFVDLRFDWTENGKRRSRYRGVDVSVLLAERQATMDAFQMSFADGIGDPDDDGGEPGDEGDPLAGLDEESADVFAMEVLERFFESEVGAVELELADLAASPDGRWLAATLAINYPSFDGSEDIIYGVLIPLDRGGLAAIPYARNVTGRAIWNGDSDRLYFMARDKVWRLELALRRFDDGYPETEASPRPDLKPPPQRSPAPNRPTLRNKLQQGIR